MEIELIFELVSFSLFTFEIMLWVSLKKTIKKKKEEQIFVPPFTQMLGNLNQLHIAIYGGFYLIAVLIARLFPILFSLIISFQVISILVNISLLKNIKEEH
ncbi:hypothetical protein DID75_03675 [Candidatus Marinamargulisbacteria bacterium SCGC AG-410-N11]|nr:hypothetical protein DID75_03675 [Candidatus Marinamargulisbacteria bacterium SCGC AG-410-N11]